MVTYARWFCSSLQYSTVFIDLLVIDSVNTLLYSVLTFKNEPTFDSRYNRLLVFEAHGIIYSR